MLALYSIYSEGTDFFGIPAPYRKIPGSSGSIRGSLGGSVASSPGSEGGSVSSPSEDLGRFWKPVVMEVICYGMNLSKIWVYQKQKFQCSILSV